jgi:hypothetical protein
VANKRQRASRALPVVRTGQGSTKLSRDEFARRLRERLYDPAFAIAAEEIDRIVEIAWDGYDEYRKSPRTRRAGRGFADPDYELPIEWLAARDAIRDAQLGHDDPGMLVLPEHAMVR